MPSAQSKPPTPTAGNETSPAPARDLISVLTELALRRRRQRTQTEAPSTTVR